VSRKLLGSDEPMMVPQANGVDSDEVIERNADDPAPLEEVAYWYHGKGHVRIAQDVHPDNTAAIVVGIEDGWSGIAAVIEHSIPMPQHDNDGCQPRKELVKAINLAA